MLWALLLGLLPKSGSYVVHFSSSQALQHHDSSAAGVNLSVAGRRFQCQLPSLGQGRGGRRAYTAQLRSAGLQGHCVRGRTDDQQVRISRLVAMWPSGQQRLDSAGAAGFEQRYLGAGLHAILSCTCRQSEETETPERRRPVPCMLGEHVWTPTEMGEDLAMVVGVLSQTLFLRWIQRGAPKKLLQDAYRHSALS